MPLQASFACDTHDSVMHAGTSLVASGKKAPLIKSSSTSPGFLFLCARDQRVNFLKAVFLAAKLGQQGSSFEEVDC